jgi:hypothetical protein
LLPLFHAVARTFFIGYGLSDEERRYDTSVDRHYLRPLLSAALKKRAMNVVRACILKRLLAYDCFLINTLEVDTGQREAPLLVRQGVS